MRFNVTSCDNSRVLRWLEQIVAQQGRSRPARIRDGARAASSV
jgi:hypothetical protein